MMPGEERLLLFSRARSGEEEAFAEIVTAYENFVYRIAIGITGQKEDAEDVTQETFLRLESPPDAAVCRRGWGSGCFCMGFA